ncbi:Odorant receptor Or2, partial [Anthophora quadrimaculata]
MIHYKSIKNYMNIVGINPYQDERANIALQFMALFISISVMIPMIIEFYVATCEKNFDEVIQVLPGIIAQTGGLLKIMNISVNKANFQKLFDLMVRRWELLEAKDEIEVLEEYTKRGIKLRGLYKDMIWTVLLVYMSLPLINPILDVVIPLNETRPRRHMFPINYIFIDEYEYFYSVNSHLYTGVLICGLMIIPVDMLYITITFHLCGLFAICGHRIQVTTEMNIVNKDGSKKPEADYKQFKQCVTMHYEVLQYHQIFERSSRYMYLFQVGLNVFIISVTAVACVMNIDRHDELVRLTMFIAAQKFHLLILSLPGQMLLDQSLGLTDIIYGSKWYQLPTKEQKMIHTMQIRSIRPCILTAGGVHQMNIESFGVVCNNIDKLMNYLCSNNRINTLVISVLTIKACMSYFMMFLSLKE